MQNELQQLIEAVQNSVKYRQVCRPFIRRIGEAELSKRRNLKAAIKATKNKLHQVGGAYLDRHMDYEKWLEDLREAAGDPDNLRSTCETIMQHHASTRERLPLLGEFYATLFADLGPVQSVVDVACGLNPLAIPWMPLADDAVYVAWDIYADMMHFLEGVLDLIGVRGRAVTQDVEQLTVARQVDVVLILKTLPCLEQVDKSAGLRLLERLYARHIIVSYPIASLGGREKGMAAHYEGHLRELLADKQWDVRRYAFDEELAFILTP